MSDAKSSTPNGAATPAATAATLVPLVPVAVAVAVVVTVAAPLELAVVVGLEPSIGMVAPVLRS